MQVKIKKLKNNAVIPKYSKPGDAGLDLVATEVTFTTEHIGGDVFVQIATVKFGLALEIPKGFVGLIFPRSSIYNKGCLLTNAVGVIDSGYRGEISAKFEIISIESFGYKVGDKCAQLIIMPYPEIELVITEELSESDRGVSGYGSTGN
jgi:dUTP pyrophosphatase